MTADIKRFLISLLLGFPLVLAAQAPPFRITPQGTVSREDLLRATQRPASRDRITDEELQSIRIRNRLDYGPGFSATKEPQTRPVGDYYANSLILTDGTNHTVLPHSSILYLPPQFAARVIEEPKGDLVLWPSFVKQNWRWVRTHEVTLAVATGEEPLHVALRQQFEKSNYVVVSVLMKNPISVLPPAAPAAETASAAARDSATKPSKS